LDSSSELRTNLLRFMLISLSVMALATLAVPDTWISLVCGLLACSVLAAGAFTVIQDKRGTLSGTRRAVLNRSLEDIWPWLVSGIPIMLGGIIRRYFPSLSGWLSLPMLVFLLGTMVWARQRGKELKLRRRS
jgi:hypothetical protein